jgi:hypothetical protein
MRSQLVSFLWFLRRFKASSVQSIDTVSRVCRPRARFYSPLHSYSNFQLLTTSQNAEIPQPHVQRLIFLSIAHEMIEDDGELRYDDFSAIHQLNGDLYTLLDAVLWHEAAHNKQRTQLVLTHLIKNNLARLAAFLDLGADVDVPISDSQLSLSQRTENSAKMGATMSKRTITITERKLGCPALSRQKHRSIGMK